MSNSISRDGTPAVEVERYERGLGVSNVVSYELGRVRQLLPRLIGRGMAFSSASRFDDTLVAAVREYYGLDVDVATAEADLLAEEGERICFYPWFLWDWRSHPDALTIGEEFLGESDLGPYERRLLEALCGSYVTFFEALEDAGPEGVLVRDLATGRDLHITDDGLAGDLFKGHLLQARLVPIQTEQGPLILVDAVYACLPPEAHDQVQAELREFTETTDGPPATPDAIVTKLKGCVSELLTFADQLLVELSGPPEAKGSAGADLVLCQARLRGEAATRLDAKLNAGHASIAKIKSGLWQLRSGEEPLGFIHRAAPQRLMICATSIERLDVMAERLLELFGTVVPALRSIDDFDNAVRQWAEHGGSQAWQLGAPEVADAVVAWLSFWIRTWADATLETLDDQTPREVMREPGGARAVEDVFERLSTLRVSDTRDVLGPVFARLRDELGLL